MHKVLAFVAGLVVGGAASGLLVCLVGGVDIAAPDGEKHARRGNAGLIGEVAPCASSARQVDVDRGAMDDGGDAEGGAAMGRATEDPAGEEGDGGEGDGEGAEATRPKKLVFKDNSRYTNGVEQLLNMALPAAPGAPVPPLPIISDEGMADELARAMQHEITADEADDEKSLERKMQIVQGKLEIAEVTDSGEMTVSEYVNALREQANDNAEFLGEAQKVHNEIFNDEEVTDEQYEAARDQINEKLRERGLPEIDEREE